MWKYKNKLFLGVISTTVAPIVIAIACTENNEKKTKKTSEELETVIKTTQERELDSSLLEKFPKDLIVDIEDNDTNIEIREKLKSSLKKNTNDLTDKWKKSFLFFIDKYFEQGKLDIEKNTFTINYNGQKYQINYQKGQIFEVKIDLQENDSEEIIIAKVLQALKQLDKSKIDEGFSHVMKYHFFEACEIDTYKQTLTFWHVHSGENVDTGEQKYNNYIIYYLKK